MQAKGALGKTCAKLFQDILENIAFGVPEISEGKDENVAQDKTQIEQTKEISDKDTAQNEVPLEPIPEQATEAFKEASNYGVREFITCDQLDKLSPDWLMHMKLFIRRINDAEYSGSENDKVEVKIMRFINIMQKYIKYLERKIILVDGEGIPIKKVFPNIVYGVPIGTHYVLPTDNYDKFVSRSANYRNKLISLYNGVKKTLRFEDFTQAELLKRKP